MTNKEWLSSLTAEEWYMKVRWLFHEYGKRYDNTYLAIIEWLKEEHEQKVVMPMTTPQSSM